MPLEGLQAGGKRQHAWAGDAAVAMIAFWDVVDPARDRLCGSADVGLTRRPLRRPGDRAMRLCRHGDGYDWLAVMQDEIDLRPRRVNSNAETRTE